MASYSPGHVFGRGELDVFFEHKGRKVDPVEILFDLFYFCLGRDLQHTEIEILPVNRTPVNPSPGEYYAAFTVSPEAESGEYGLRWRWRMREGGPLHTAVMHFHVD